MNMHLFNLAREEMLNSTYDNGSRRLGAIAVLNGTIIARGSNTNKTHTIQKRLNKVRFEDYNSCTMPALEHAELKALRAIRFLDPKALKKVQIYVYREFVNGKPAMARPCPSCMKFIKELGIQRVFYSTNYGYAEEKLIY